jgi:excisionase family DNA binding protein
MEREYLTIKEFAGKLGVHPNTIRNAIASNRIECIRVGSKKKSRIRISVNEIRRMARFDLDKVIEAEVQKRLKERLKI